MNMLGFRRGETRRSAGQDGDESQVAPGGSPHSMRAQRGGSLAVMTRIVSFLLVVIAVGAIGCDGGGGGAGGMPDTGPGMDECTYPESSGRLELGETMPPMRWNGVLDADGVASDL